MATTVSNRRISQRKIGSSPKRQIIRAYGGDIVASSGSFRYHIFTSTGNFNLIWHDPDYSSEPIYYAVVGGGGGGMDGYNGDFGSGNGGDGGSSGDGGTMVSGSITAFYMKLSNNCNAVVGAGGTSGGNGTNSYFESGSGVLGFTFSRKTGNGGTGNKANTAGLGGFYDNSGTPGVGENGGDGQMADGDYINSLFTMGFKDRYGVGATTEHYGLGGFGGGGGGGGGSSNGGSGGTGQFQVYSADGAMGGIGGGGGSAPCSIGNGLNGTNASSAPANTGHGGGGGGGGGGPNYICGQPAGTAGTGTSGGSGIIVLFYRFEV